MARLFTTFLVLFPLFMYPSLTSSASSDTLSSTFASNQIKFWSENVQNKMPAPILKKLSPLTKRDCDYYSNMISNNHKFSADARFCSLAKLACSSVFDENLVRTTEEYRTKSGTTRNVYDINAAASDIAVKNADPFSFFRHSNLKDGNLIHLPNLKESLPDRAFLPPQIVSKIPLTLNGITKIFRESAIGTTKESIEINLSYCDAAAIKGETKSCPKSLEEMINFSKFSLGGNKLLALTSKSTKGSNTELMIKKIKKFDADKIVACHEAFLPFAAYFCHSIPSSNLYSVDLVEPKTGASVNTMLAMCHMETSSWPENHVAFKILKFKPGQGEACHWFTQIDLAWIPAEAST